MKKIIFGALAISLLAAGCKKWVDDVYLNPNNPTVVDPETVLPPVTANVARGVQFDARMTGAFVGYWCRVTSFDSWDRHGYIAGNDAGGEKWRTHYWNLGQNLVNAIRDSRNDRPEIAGVSYAFFAYSWLHLADYHGPVILKQAFDATRLTFDYDEQQEAYEYVLQICDSAIQYLDRGIASGGASRLAQADRFLYSGDLQKWKRFVYGVKAKTFQRWWNKPTYSADSVIKYVNLSFTSIQDDANIKFENNANFPDRLNFFGPRRANLGVFRPGKWYMDMLSGVYTNGAIDPRRAYIFTPSLDGQFRGTVPSLGETVSTQQTRSANLWGFKPTSAAANNNAPATDDTCRTFFKNASFAPILTYTELQFLKAEAAFKKRDMATALQSYRAGIQASFDQLSTHFTGYTRFTTAQRDAYLNNPSIVPTAADALTLQQIMMQKYIALWGHGWEETYTDMRRHNWDTVNIYKGFSLTNFFPDNNGKFANRVRPRYNSEYLWNAEALRKVGGFDPDYHTKPVWFQQN